MTIAFEHHGKVALRPPLFTSQGTHIPPFPVDRAQGLAGCTKASHSRPLSHTYAICLPFASKQTCFQGRG